jgi:uncharacterized membrane protein YbjE (DUF340 family)
MTIGIVLLLTGIIIGYLLRNKRKIIRISTRLTDGAIFLLLFFLGVSVGMNERVISNFQHIGLQSFLLTIFATIGSILVTFVFYRIFLKRR